MLGKHYDPYSTASDFFIPQNIYQKPSAAKLNFSERERIKQEINKAMQVYREGQLQTDLGIVGEILGYTQTAAAVGLAIYHLYKFKKKK